MNVGGRRARRAVGPITGAYVTLQLSALRVATSSQVNVITTRISGSGYVVRFPSTMLLTTSLSFSGVNGSRTIGTSGGSADSSSGVERPSLAR
jgi:hypothetical protein